MKCKLSERLRQEILSHRLSVLICELNGPVRKAIFKVDGNKNPHPYADVYIEESGLYFDLGADGTVNEFVPGDGGVFRHTIPDSVIQPGGFIRLAMPSGFGTITQEGYQPGGFMNFFETYRGLYKDIPSVTFCWSMLRSHGQ